MRSTFFRALHCTQSALAFALLVVTVAPVRAQTSTGTIRGTITGAGGAPVTDAQIGARNIQTGAQRGTTSHTDGSYVLSGLVPGTYDLDVRRIGTTAQTRRVVVQIGATQIQDFSLAAVPAQLQQVVITSTPTPETRTSEVATNVTQAQIENLPSASRNFLELAALAPGVNVSSDRINGTNFRTMQAGGQSASAVNLFIDGTSFKNDLTAGGIAGQDASRGNPFPQNAIQEYRVITQNYKAEYQKASSAVITATTKSGTNVWSGNLLAGFQNQRFVDLDSFQRKDKAAIPRRSPSRRTIARSPRSASAARSSRTSCTSSRRTKGTSRIARAAWISVRRPLAFRRSIPWDSRSTTGLSALRSASSSCSPS
jgi:hypothetical protein